MSNGRETTVLDFSGIEGDGVLGELEAFLDERCELADATPLLAEDFLGVCCADDWMYIRTRGIGTGREGVGEHTDISHSRRDTDFDT